MVVTGCESDAGIAAVQAAGRSPANRVVRVHSVMSFLCCAPLLAQENQSGDDIWGPLALLCHFLIEMLPSNSF